MNKHKIKEQIASDVGIMLLHIFDLVDEISEESFQDMFNESIETLDDGKIARSILALWFKVYAEKRKEDLLSEAVYTALEKFQKQYIEGESANDELRVE